MYILTHTHALSLYDQDVLSHEYTHALQDQNYGFNRLWPRAAHPGIHDSDREMAVRALLEGDAVDEQIRYAQTVFTPQQYAVFAAEAQQGAQQVSPGVGAAPFLQDQIDFPYKQGRAFYTQVTADLSGDNSGDIAATFQHPPVSTREILHPDVYMSSDSLVVPDLPVPQPALSSDWKRVDSDVFGQFRLQEMLALPPGATAGAADGWRADRYALFDRGRDYLMAWRLHTDSPASAQTLTGALAAYFTYRYGTAATQRNNEMLYTSTSGIALIRAQGAEIYALLASRASLQAATHALESLIPSPFRAAPFAPSVQQTPLAGPPADMAPLPAPRAYPSLAVGHDGNVYIFGGIDASGATMDTTYIYHPNTNTWATRAPMPTSRAGAQAVTMPDGRIVVLGGGTRCGDDVLCRHGTVYRRADVYDPRADTWTRFVPMAHPRYRLAALLFQGRVYAIGGADGTRALASVEVYDARTGAWHETLALPRPVEAAAAAVDAAGDVDVMGGTDGHVVYDTLYRFTGRAWRRGASLLQPTAGAVAVPEVDGLTYVLGGAPIGAVGYDPATNRWVDVPPLPAPRCCMGVASMADGTLYLVGGNGPRTHIDHYSPGYTLSPASGPTGTSAALAGSGLQPGAGISLLWDGPSGTGRMMAAGTTTGAGALYQPIGFTVPTDATPGVHHVYVYVDRGTAPEPLTFVVTRR